MKVNVVKAIIAFGVSALLGLLCYEIAKVEESRNWISLATAAISIFICLGSAIACDYKSGYRNANMKVAAWVFTVLVVMSNFIFSCFMYNITVYVVIVSLLTLMNVAITYCLYKPKDK